MRKIIWLTSLIVIATMAMAQSVRFGIPCDFAVSSGDRIILNTPINGDGRFEDSPSLEQLIELLNRNTTLTFRIEINDFKGSDELCQAYSSALAKNLNKKLGTNCPASNFTIKANGNSNPIFHSDNNVEYWELNRRMEIFVE